MLGDLLERLERDGWVLLEGAFSCEEAAELTRDFQAALARLAEEGEAIRSRSGGVYAARNVLALFPRAAMLWRRPPLLDLLEAALGADYGLVRGLYFDKPPERSWSLPWHKDRTIAVAEHRGGTYFRHPTTKAGVPHVEAPDELLMRMLTLRIHLDDVTDENGPLQVLSGSHWSSAEPPHEPMAGRPIEERRLKIVLARAGDVLAMRPLLTHSSGHPQPGASRHRRILHLEFSGVRTLPGGYAWRDFVSPEDAGE